MGRLIVNVATTVNGAFEAPTPAPDGWLVLDADSQQASLDMWEAADAMVLGRKTYEGLSTVWPPMTDVPGMETYAHRMNTMKKYAASRTLTEPLSWNATLLDADLTKGITRLKAEHTGILIATGAGPLVDDLVGLGLVDEVWFTVSPYLSGPSSRVFDHLGAIRLEFVSATAFPSGVVQLRYRPGPVSVGPTT